MRNYSKIDAYYSELVADIYPQPPDERHLQLMAIVISKWLAPLNLSSVLDVGCGEGEAQDIFTSKGIPYYGIAQGSDVARAKAAGRNVEEQDFNFLNFEDSFVDLVFSRHSLEHSPFPLLTLMEWHRVSKKWLCLILPNPQHYTFVGRNHYSVVDGTQAAWLLRRAGWKLYRVFIQNDEMRFLCTKASRVGFEGWAANPINPEIYELERDLAYARGEIPIPQVFFK